MHKKKGRRFNKSGALLLSSKRKKNRGENFRKNRNKNLAANAVSAVQTGNSLQETSKEENMTVTSLDMNIKIEPYDDYEEPSLPVIGEVFSKNNSEADVQKENRCENAKQHLYQSIKAEICSEFEIERQIKLLQDFIIPSLNSKRFGENLMWHPRDERVFMLRWIHKAKNSWNEEDCKVFMAWDRLKGRCLPKNEQDFVDSKQRLRAALRNMQKSKTIEELPSPIGYRSYRIKDPSIKCKNTKLPKKKKVSSKHPKALYKREDLTKKRTIPFQAKEETKDPYVKLRDLKDSSNEIPSNITYNPLDAHFWAPVRILRPRVKKEKDLAEYESHLDLLIGVDLLDKKSKKKVGKNTQIETQKSTRGLTQQSTTESTHQSNTESTQQSTTESTQQSMTELRQQSTTESIQQRPTESTQHSPTDSTEQSKHTFNNTPEFSLTEDQQIKQKAEEADAEEMFRKNLFEFEEGLKRYLQKNPNCSIREELIAMNQSIDKIVDKSKKEKQKDKPTSRTSTFKEHQKVISHSKSKKLNAIASQSVKLIDKSKKKKKKPEKNKTDFCDTQNSTSKAASKKTGKSMDEIIKKLKKHLKKNRRKKELLNKKTKKKLSENIGTFYPSSSTVRSVNKKSGSTNLVSSRKLENLFTFEDNNPQNYIDVKSVSEEKDIDICFQLEKEKNPYNWELTNSTDNESAKSSRSSTVEDGFSFIDSESHFKRRNWYFYDDKL